MREFSRLTDEATNATERHGDAAVMLLVDPNEETYHVQADGFWGDEKGFHDVEELWRQRQKQD